MPRARLSLLCVFACVLSVFAELASGQQQFSFCLLTSGDASPTLAGTSVTANASGILTASSSTSTTYPYIVTALTGSMTIQRLRATYPLSLLDVDTYGGNDNQFGYNASTGLTTQNSAGISVAIPISQFNAYSSGSSFTSTNSSLALGGRFAWYMQPYTAGGPVLSCSSIPLPVQQFSYCLLTSSSTPVNLSTSAAAVTSTTSGILNAALQSSPATYLITALSGSMRIAASGAVYPVSLLPSGSYGNNDNAFTWNNATLATTQTSAGITYTIGPASFNAYGSSYTFTSSNSTIGNFGGRYGFFVQSYTAGGAVLLCNGSSSVIVPPGGGGIGSSSSAAASSSAAGTGSSVSSSASLSSSSAVSRSSSSSSSAISSSVASSSAASSSAVSSSAAAASAVSSSSASSSAAAATSSSSSSPSSSPVVSLSSNPTSSSSTAVTASSSASVRPASSSSSSGAAAGNFVTSSSFSADSPPVVSTTSSSSSSSAASSTASDNPPPTTANSASTASVSMAMMTALLAVLAALL